MPETKIQHNLNFLSYLNSIGLIVPEKLKELEEKLSNDENRKLLFEISSYFHSLTASDWFDITTSLYSNWIEHSTPSKQLQHHKLSQETPKTALTVSANLHSKFLESSGSNVKASQNEESNGSNARSMLLTPPQKISADVKIFEDSPLSQDNLSLQQNDSGGLPYSARVEKLFFVVNKMLLRSAFWNLKNQMVRMSRSDTFSSTLSPSRSRFEKLYEDHFINKGNQQLRSQYYSLLEMRDHTFSPKINQKRLSKEGLENSPVFERLTKTKPLSEKLLALSRENREIEGATFSPRINRSPTTSVDERYESPAARKEKTVQRLYNDAFEKERRYMAKRMGKQAMELDGCTFIPVTNTSTSVGSPTSLSERDRLLRSRLDASVHRLHTEAMKRDRDLIIKQGEQESAKLAEHPFKPTINSQKTIQAKVNVHHRLYSEAKRRIDIQKSHEEQMAASDKCRSPSQKLKSGKQPLAQNRGGKSGLPKFQEISNLEIDSTPPNKGNNILADLDQGNATDRGFNPTAKFLPLGNAIHSLTSRK